MRVAADPRRADVKGSPGEWLFTGEPLGLRRTDERPVAASSRRAGSVSRQVVWADTDCR